MTQTPLEVAEIARRAKALYAEKIRAEVETPENIGKMVIIDVETGDYALDQSGLAAAERLRLQHPDARPYGIRVGYRTPDAIGAALERTVK